MRRSNQLFRTNDHWAGAENAPLTANAHFDKGACYVAIPVGYYKPKWRTE